MRLRQRTKFVRGTKAKQPIDEASAAVPQLAEEVTVFTIRRLAPPAALAMTQSVAACRVVRASIALPSYPIHSVRRTA